MLKVKKNPKIIWLFGGWRANSEDRSCLFIIGKTSKGFRVQCFDESCGEELVVSKVKWDGKFLSFETFTPSNKWRTKNRLEAISATKIVHELTLWQSYKRVIPKTIRKGCKNSKINWLGGQWQNAEEYIDVLFTVDETVNGFRVQAFEESDGEELVVSKIKWDGKFLSFETFTPSNKSCTKNRLEIISPSKAIHELTFYESWKKVKPEIVKAIKNKWPFLVERV